LLTVNRLKTSGSINNPNDNDWVERCITWEVEGIRQRGRLKKTWWDCVKNDMESLGLSQKDVQSRNTVETLILVAINFGVQVH